MRFIFAFLGILLLSHILSGYSPVKAYDASEPLNFINLTTFSAFLIPKTSPQSLLSIIDEKERENDVIDYCLNVPVLLYHHIQPMRIAASLGHAQLTVGSDYFDMQMAYLVANKYHPISADELAYALNNERELPSKSILITLDDGYDDNYNYAFPILKKYNLVGNFMISTGLIEKNGYLTWRMLSEMSQNPLIHIYNHTFSHAALGEKTAEEIKYEIITANKQLENNLGIKSKIFTYPYGSYSPQVIDELKEQEFSAALSTDNGIRQCKSYIYTLKRMHIGNAPLSLYGF